MRNAGWGYKETHAMTYMQAADDWWGRDTQARKLSGNFFFVGVELEHG